MKSVRRGNTLSLLGLAACNMLLVIPAGAQTSSSAPSLTALKNFEQSIQASDFLPGVPANIPGNVLASVTGGALDLRAQTNYNAQTNILNVTFFTVQTGSPTPTNLGQLTASNVFGTATINVNQLYVTTNAVMLVGTMSASSSALLGSVAGTPASFSFSYNSATPPALTNAILTVAGTLAVVSPTATGTVTITQPASGGGTGGTTSNGVTIVVTGGTGIGVIGPNNFAVDSNQVFLSASQSTSSNPGALTYSWTSNATSAPTVILGANTATPMIELLAMGSYQFTLTVTDAKGVSATANITVQYF